MDNLIDIFEKYGFKITKFQENQFNKYFQFLIEENEKYNLTAITDEKEVVFKHFLDSVLPANELPKNASVIDVGTGAGFPGVPLKILRPDIKLTLLDSLQKRINFLNNLLSILEIDGVTTIHARAEDYVINKREAFDIAISRAVASVPTLAEYLIPYTKLGGKILMYKGNKIHEELSEGENAIKILGATVKDIKEFQLNEIESQRFILVLEKTKHTDKKYPRGKNLPKQKPLL